MINTQFHISKLAKSINTAIALSLALSAPVFAAEKDANIDHKITDADKVTVATKKVKEDDIEVITVQGIRGSLKENLNNKRFANTIVDSINTEDIAKNPDKNMAEALQRVAGVQISREFGEGSEVSIRGTAPELTNTLVNGQSTLSGQTLPSRAEKNSFDFSSVPASQVSRIEVYKSPQADIDAGGIGGTVILHTKKPLEMENGHGLFSAETEYNEGSEETSPQFNSLYNWVDESQTFGANINVTYQERNSQTDSSNGHDGWWDYLEKNDHEMIVNRIKRAKGEIPYRYNGREGTGTQDEPGGYIGKPGSNRLFKAEERVGIVTAFQYAPSEDLSFDLTYSRNKSDIDQYTRTMYPRMDRLIRTLYNQDGPTEDPRLITDPVRDLVLEAEMPIQDIRKVNSWGTSYGDFNDVIGWEMQDRDGSWSKQERIHLNMDYNHDNFDLKLQAGRVTGDSRSADEGMHMGINTESANLDDVSLRYGYDPDKDQVSWDVGDWITDPTDEMKVNSMFRTRTYRDNSEDFLQGDITFHLDNDFYISSIKTGVKYQDVQRDSHSYSQGTYRVDDIFAGDVKGGLVKDIDTGGDKIPGTYFDIDKGIVSDIWENGYLSGVEDYRADTNCEDAILASGGSYYGCKGDMTENYAARSLQNQEILSYYAMANFEGERFRGNFGIRVVETDRSNTQLIFAPEGTDESLLVGDDLDRMETGNSSSTRDVLPSFNLSYNITDDLIMRTAASKVISHPSLHQLRSITNVNGNFGKDGERLAEGSQRVGSAGNPDLGSYEAKQYELGLEWYYGEASMFSVTAFAKHMSDLIYSRKGLVDLNEGYDKQGNPVSGEYLVTTYLNTADQDVKGYEVQLQHDFNNGYGAIINYTYTDVPDVTYFSTDFDPVIDEDAGLDENGNPIVIGFNGSKTDTEVTVKSKGNSKHTFNTSAYYEDNDFSARLSYNYRSEYYQGYDSESSRMREARGQLDLKLTYNFTENLVANFSVINLTEASNDLYLRRAQLELPEEGLEQFAADNGVTVEELMPYYTDRKEKVTTRRFNSGRRFYAGISYTFE